MSSITSSDDHSSIGPAPSIKIDLSDDEPKRDIDDVEGHNSDVLTILQYINEESSIDMS